MPFFEGAQTVSNTGCDFKEINGSHNVYNNSVHDDHKGDNVTYNTRNSHNSALRHVRPTYNNHVSHNQTARNVSAAVRKPDVGSKSASQGDCRQASPSRVNPSPGARMIDSSPAHAFVNVESLGLGNKPNVREGDVEMGYAWGANANADNRMGKQATAALPRASPPHRPRTPFKSNNPFAPFVNSQVSLGQTAEPFQPTLQPQQSDSLGWPWDD